LTDRFGILRRAVLRGATLVALGTGRIELAGALGWMRRIRQAVARPLGALRLQLRLALGTRHVRVDLFGDAILDDDELHAELVVIAAQHGARDHPVGIEPTRHARLGLQAEVDAEELAGRGQPRPAHPDAHGADVDRGAIDPKITDEGDDRAAEPGSRLCASLLRHVHLRLIPYHWFSESLRGQKGRLDGRTARENDAIHLTRTSATVRANRRVGIAPTEMDTVMTEPWAIVRILLEPSRDGRDAWAADLDRLHELAAVLAGAPDVGGVEQTTELPERPELRLYTTPAALDEVTARAHAWAQRFALTVTITGEVRTDDDWRDAWKEFYRPILLGSSDTSSGGDSNRAGALLLRPSWIPRNPTDPEREVVLDPGRAFGTGLHETTRLCLDRICELAARGFAATHVLDLGCGSGILALCAARLFPGSRVVAVDDDPEATATTVENAAINGLALETVTGDLPGLPATPTFDLVLANIRAETLVPRAEALAQRTRAGAEVVLSGVLVDEREEVERAFVAAGFVVQAPSRTMGTWCAIDLRAP
jgi:ribosomal protein L11 methyltransferase